MNLDRVHADLEAGRAWKALDRLQGMRATAPADQEVLELLGRLRADMGDLPGAGLAWFLTDGEDPRREEAFGAMRERHGRRATDLVHHLKVRTAIDRFPPGVQARLRDLEDQLDATGLRGNPPAADVERKEPRTLQNLAGVAGCAGLALLLLVPWLRGILAFFQ